MSQDGGNREPLVIELSDEESATQVKKVSITPLVIELSDEEDATQKPQLHGKTIKHESDLDDIFEHLDTRRALHESTSKESAKPPIVTVLDVGGEVEEFEKVNTTARTPERISHSPLSATMVDEPQVEPRKAQQTAVQNEQQQGTSDIESASTLSTTLAPYESQFVDNNTNSTIVQGAFDVRCALTPSHSGSSISTQVRDTKNRSDDEAGSKIHDNTAIEDQQHKDNIGLASDRTPAIGKSAEIFQRPWPSFYAIDTDSSMSISGIIAEEQPTVQNLPYGPHHQELYTGSRDLSEPLRPTEVAEPIYRAPIAYMGPLPKSEHLKCLDITWKPPVQEVMSSPNKAVAPTHIACTGSAEMSVAPLSATSDAAESTKEASRASHHRSTMDQVMLSEMDRILQVQRRRLQEEEDERAIRAELLYQKRHRGPKYLEQQRTGMGPGVTSKAFKGDENLGLLGKSKLTKAMTKIIPATTQNMQPAFENTKHHHRQGEDEKHESMQYDPAITPSKLWTTNKDEPLEELLTGDCDQTEHQKTRRSRSPAWSSRSDLFIRSPTPPLAPPKRKRNHAEALKTAQFVADGGQKRERRHLKLDDFWGHNAQSATASATAKRYQNSLTLKDGYFDCHQERIKALKERADRENRVYEQKQYDGQEIDLKLDENDGLNTKNTKPRSTVGEKGVSKETMLRWQMDEVAQAFPSPSASEAGDEQFDVPKILYEYHVQRRIRFNGQSETEGGLISFGPYYTIGEANAIATQKVRQQFSEDTSMIFKPGAWSYNYGKDDTGTEHHTLESGGGSIQTWVSRSIASPNEGISVPLKAFTTPAWLYIAMLSSSAPMLQAEGHSTADTSEVDHDRPNTSQDTLSRSVIKACTLLDLANRAAGEKWIEIQMATLPKDSIGDILRSEMAMNLRQELEDMDEENVGFNRKFRDPRTGRETQIWVEMVEVEGPRN